MTISETDVFAARFRRFLGEDLSTIPEKYRAHFAEGGVVRCTEEVPCYVMQEKDAIYCPCLGRMRKWLAFWRLVRADMEDAYPTLLCPLSTENRIGPFHRPVFTHICVCGKREEVYGFGGYGINEAPLSPDGWVWFTYETDAHEIDERCVCSHACGEQLSKPEKVSEKVYHHV